MNALFRVAALGIAAVCICAILQKKAPETALLVAIAACACGLFILSHTAEAIRDYVLMLSQLSNLSMEVLKPVFQCLGIGLAAKLAADMAGDASQSAIASLIDLAGSLCCLYVTLPLAKRTIDLVESML